MFVLWKKYYQIVPTIHADFIDVKLLLTLAHEGKCLKTGISGNIIWPKNNITLIDLYCCHSFFYVIMLLVCLFTVHFYSKSTINKGLFLCFWIILTCCVVLYCNFRYIKIRWCVMAANKKSFHYRTKDKAVNIYWSPCKLRLWWAKPLSYIKL